jgi:hypothetical protein
MTDGLAGAPSVLVLGANGQLARRRYRVSAAPAFSR